MELADRQLVQALSGESFGLHVFLLFLPLYPVVPQDG